MTETTTNAFSSTAALLFGWKATLANPKILLPISIVGAFLALPQS